jgi:hypothetical protein
VVMTGVPVPAEALASMSPSSAPESRRGCGRGQGSRRSG